jgi:Tol biopolymer transport system component
MFSAIPSIVIVEKGSGFLSSMAMRKTKANAFRVSLVTIALCVGQFLLTPQQVSAQTYFGKNKIQYVNFDWQVMTTEHFRVYFYAEETEVAQVAARIAEDAYHPLAAKFNCEIPRKIPLIIYSAPRYFAQTNVLPGLLPESVGGFTEFMKGRVVVPFHGSYFDFRHVIIHELVHVFTMSRLEENVGRLARPHYVYPPLWFMEGLAEYWSETWDTEADMIVKDMVVKGNLLPLSEFWKVQGSYFMYKLGQSVCEFIDHEYGADKLTAIFENWYKGRDFEEVVKYTLGDNLDKLSEKWHYYLQKKYYPEYANLGLPRMESKQITYDGYCVKGVPIRWDDGKGESDWLVYMASRRGYTGIYMKPLRDDKKGVRTLVKGERSTRFESLYLLRSGIDATSSGQVVFSSKSKDRDVIYVYGIREGKVTASYPMTDLVAARSPQFSPDEMQIVFTGIRTSGQADLYTGAYRALTDDLFNDTDPAFTPDGGRIVFVSDRAAAGQSGATNLFDLDIARQENIRQLTYGAFLDQTPCATGNGVYFSSNRTGSVNLFLLETDGRITRQSAYVTGALDPRLRRDGSALVYTGYQDMGFQVYEMDLITEPEPLPKLLATAADSATWEPLHIDSQYSKASIKYDTDYSLDIAQSSIAYDPIYGSMGGLQAQLSDVLGNHAWYFVMMNTADTKDEFLSSFNVGVTYINRERRLNWGVGAFHLYDEYYNDVDQYYYQRQAGAIGLVSYPVSKFNRFDLTTFARYENKDRRYGLKDREGFLVSTFVSWVYDNAIWDISGPIEGRRYNLSVGITHSVSDNRNYNRVAFADIRHYIRLGSNSAIANRLYGYTSAGLEPQRRYFGGSWSFRGYDDRAFYNRNIIFVSNELRFPLIDALLIGFPIGGLDFRGIRGALFFDAGSAWDDEFDKMLGSYGAGFRVSLGYMMLLRFDFAKRTDFHEISPGIDFDFFFGWNF